MTMRANTDNATKNEEIIHVEETLHFNEHYFSLIMLILVSNANWTRCLSR